MTQADIGLAVMGENLILNIESKGYTVAVYNRTVDKVDALLSGRGAGKRLIGAHSVEEFVQALKRPRKLILLVKAGAPVDEMINLIAPHLEKGDIIIDGGNSLFQDSIRRTKDLGQQGLLYVGSGVSGGEEGALRGPSLMPGGNPAAWPHIKEIFQAIAAKAPDGQPCCEWMGEDGAGHFVKMTHNGIEYGDMQLICEAYHIMRDGAKMSANEMAQTFAAWNEGELNSYLIEITSEILAFKDSDGGPLVEKILDTAGQKGTGKWTVISALDMGVPVTLISEAVFARCLSALKEERVSASERFAGQTEKGVFSNSRDMIEDLRQALLASKIASYAQGFMLLRQAAKDYKWNLNYGGIASIWRGGCIIRSVFLSRIKEAYDRDAGLTNLLMDDYFADIIKKCEPAWRRVIASAVQAGIPAPALSSALNFYDGYRAARLPANLLQAQRDYFGAHTYERIDRPRGEFSHTNWTGRGGAVSSSTYNA